MKKLETKEDNLKLITFMVYFENKKEFYGTMLNFHKEEAFETSDPSVIKIENDTFLAFNNTENNDFVNNCKSINKKIEKVLSKKKTDYMINLKLSSEMKKIFTITLENYRYRIPGLRELIDSISELRTLQFSDGKGNNELYFSNEEDAENGRKLINGYFKISESMTEGGINYQEKMIKEGKMNYSGNLLQEKLKISKLMLNFIEEIKNIK